AEVDLVLFLSLVSGRNAQYLIEEHVRAVPFLTRHPVATLSTGYILVDGGRVTSVEAVSQTRPLPADKPELAAAHATAARLIGMQAIYLDAGSGAPRPVAADVIRACSAAVADLTLFVGGGIKSPAQVRAARAAGADFAVVGRYQPNRPARRAVVLPTDSPLLTACAADSEFGAGFARQVDALARRGNVLSLHATGGDSPNVIRAAQAAKARGVTVVGLRGHSGGRLKDLADVALIVPSDDTARIQEIHLAIEHVICGLVEARLRE